MIRSSRQLKDLIRNMARDKSTEAHILMRNFMMERFLERVSLSRYQHGFILKGGMLVAAMVGLDARSTMDMDAAIKGVSLSVDAVKDITSEILAIPLDDGVVFTVAGISEIMGDAEYPGVRVSLISEFDGVRTPLKIDISTGDAITPQEVEYHFKLMFEEREIAILAYNLETVLAEKLETVLARDITNTRMRDFYDIYALLHLQGDRLSDDDMKSAFKATVAKRGTADRLVEAADIFDDIEADATMQKLWRAYQQNFTYAADISWPQIMEAIRSLFAISN